MNMTTEQRLADALREALAATNKQAELLKAGARHIPCPRDEARDAWRQALAAYDAQQAVPPGPWWFAASHGDVYAVGVGDVEKATGLTREDAARIVLCVNAHDALVSALHSMVIAVDCAGDVETIRRVVGEQARSALSQAGVHHA